MAAIASLFSGKCLAFSRRCISGFLNSSKKRWWLSVNTTIQQTLGSA